MAGDCWAWRRAMFRWKPSRGSPRDGGWVCEHLWSTSPSVSSLTFWTGSRMPNPALCINDLVFSSSSLSACQGSQLSSVCGRIKNTNFEGTHTSNTQGQISSIKGLNCRLCTMPFKDEIQNIANHVINIEQLEHCAGRYKFLRGMALQIPRSRSIQGVNCWTLNTFIDTWFFVWAWNIVLWQYAINKWYRCYWCLRPVRQTWWSLSRCSCLDKNEFARACHAARSDSHICRSACTLFSIDCSNEGTAVFNPKSC